MKNKLVLLSLCLLSFYSFNANAESYIFSDEQSYTLTEMPCLWSSDSCNLYDMEADLIEKCTNNGYNNCATIRSVVSKTDFSRNLFCGESSTYSCKVQVKGDR